MGIVLNCKFFYTFTPNLQTFYKIYIILGPGRDWHSPKKYKNSCIVFWKEQTINRINWKYLFVRIFGIFVTLCYGRPMSPEGGSNILLVCSEHTTHIDISIIKQHNFRFHYNMKFPKYVLFATDQTFKEILHLTFKTLNRKHLNI